MTILRSYILSLLLSVSSCGGMLSSSPHCHSPLLARGRISRGRVIKRASTRPRNNLICSGVLFATNVDRDIREDSPEEEEDHWTGIGVGIDLGTTNSAVAMMIPADDGPSRFVVFQY